MTSSAGASGEQRVEPGAQLRRERLQHGIAVAHERPQRSEQGRVGQLALAELDAVAPEDDDTGLARADHELVGEPRLADARLAGDQRQRGAALCGVAQGGLQLRELAGPPDEARARHACCHAGSMVPAAAASGAAIHDCGGHIHASSVHPDGGPVIGRMERLAPPDPLAAPAASLRGDAGRALRQLRAPEADPQHARQHVQHVPALPQRRALSQVPTAARQELPRSRAATAQRSPLMTVRPSSAMRTSGASSEIVPAKVPRGIWSPPSARTALALPSSPAFTRQTIL